MRVRLWVVLSSLGAASCGDSVVIARELVVQAISSERGDAGADAGNHTLGVPHGSSDGHPTSTAHTSPKPIVHPVEVPHRTSSSVPSTDSADGGSHIDPTTTHH